MKILVESFQIFEFKKKFGSPRWKNFGEENPGDDADAQIWEEIETAEHYFWKQMNFQAVVRVQIGVDSDEAGDNRTAGHRD